VDTREQRRRVLLATAALVLAPGVAAQSGKVARVGVLRPGSSKEPASVQREPFERGLRELGWNPGSDVVILYRYGEGNEAALPGLAAKLVKENLDLVVTVGAVGAQAVHRANPRIPVVLSATIDPVAEGLAESLARPGKNVTGIALQSFDLDAKRLEILKDAFPHVHRVAMLANPTAEPFGYSDRIKEVRAGAKRLKVDIEIFGIKNAEELAPAFTAIERGRFDALMARAEPRVMDPHRKQIVAAAARLKLPAIYWFRFYTEDGGLMSYGESIPAFHHRSASYVSRILKGAKAGDLAFERPSKFELLVNLKTAKALGVEIPKAVLFRADEVIQ
jgi:putative tryptophan/tyrosine transport system substrate-binding protein